MHSWLTVLCAPIMLQLPGGQTTADGGGWHDVDLGVPLNVLKVLRMLAMTSGQDGLLGDMGLLKTHWRVTRGVAL